ncbi:hypothetical protein EVAR_68102_1 [Eumeta japonica]|uniref:Uncharacterized protein n=1 Tax=Eumeta variegata TaxID=151549 RepID=A0A4C2A6V8_EUMVA|nr:hypothetical protein EVAR_68102_1 [Eumeta japonica]
MLENIGENRIGIANTSEMNCSNDNILNRACITNCFDVHRARHRSIQTLGCPLPAPLQILGTQDVSTGLNLFSAPLHAPLRSNAARPAHSGHTQ